MSSPLQPVDDDARKLARRLLDEARFATLGCLTDDGAPYLSRVAVMADRSGRMVALLSDISAHSRALRKDPRCGLLVGEPGGKGDPLTHPRLSVSGRMAPFEDDGLRAIWLQNYPKAKLYIDLPDFRFWRLEPASALLNAGFGQAYQITPADMLNAPRKPE